VSDTARVVGNENAVVTVRRRALDDARDMLAVARRRVSRYPRANDRKAVDAAVTQAEALVASRTRALTQAEQERDRVAKMWGVS
jgi:hypothetical protein